MAENKKSLEEVLSNFASSEEKTNLNEQQTQQQAQVPVEEPIKVPTQPSEVMQKRAAAGKSVPTQTMTAQEMFAQRAQQQLSRPSMKEAHDIRLQEIRGEQLQSGLGFIELQIDSLPTQGLFYPEGTRIFVRAASGGEIRHWSMTNEQEISEIDDALNYVFERCVRISFPGENGRAEWKDVKEIDRLYLILAVRDFTFPEGENELKVVVSENQTVPVYKDNIKFADFGEKIMKYYNPNKRCFTFPVKNAAIGEMNFYIPSIGVMQWLKGYIQKKSQRQEQFDKDFITIAPLLIKDYRGLNDASYRDLINESMNYGNYEWSLIVKVKSIIEGGVAPKLTYVDESGAEQETGLNFQGGLKSIFNLNLDEELDL